MKFKTLIILLAIGHLTFGQNINRKSGQELFDAVDTTNYYNFLTYNINGVSTRVHHLDKKDALPIIMEELENAGYKLLYENCLFKLDSGQYIVLSAYSRKSNFGFFYINDFKAEPSIADRHDKFKGSSPFDYYLGSAETAKGEPSFFKVSKFPPNIFILGATCYWYETTDNSDYNKYLVTKEIAIKILRQDIQAYLAKAPKPTK